MRCFGDRGEKKIMMKMNKKVTSTRVAFVKNGHQLSKFKGEKIDWLKMAMKIHSHKSLFKRANILKN